MRILHENAKKKKLIGKSLTDLISGPGGNINRMSP